MLQPDIALLDVNMPGGGGIRAAVEIRAVSPMTRVVALTAAADRQTVVEMLGAGCVGYLFKEDSVRTLVASLHEIAEGRSALSGGAASHIISELADQRERQAQEARKQQERIDRMRSVMADGAVWMLFQPIVDLQTGIPTGAEALARFAAAPYRGPQAWFAEATALGLTHELEIHAIRQALAAARVLPKRLTVAVNLSPSTLFTPELTHLIASFDPARLVLELTEHARVDDYDALHAALRPLRMAGTRLAVDDAGAGYASLSHILRLEPDIIKLDIAMTRGIDEDSKKRALAAAMITFAGELGATIVAEGIETTGELRTLRRLGVPLGQGLRLARPQEPPLPERVSVPFAQP